MESFVLSGSHLKTIIYTEKNKLKQSWTHHSLLSNMLIENLLYIKSESGWQLNNTTSWALQGSGTRPWALDRLIASTSPHPNSGLASFSRNKTYWTRPLYVTFFRPKAKKKCSTEDHHKTMEWSVCYANCFYVECIMMVVVAGCWATYIIVAFAKWVSVEWVSALPLGQWISLDLHIARNMRQNKRCKMFIFFMLIMIYKI